MTIPKASSLLLSVLLLAGLVIAQDDSGRKISTVLTGAAEVPGPGDTDGTGSATITLNQGQKQVCYEITVSNIAAANLAHIHRGAADVAGPVVVTLDPPADGTSKGCAENVEEALIKEIRQDPSKFYVNIHNADFPDGAVRGQLSKGAEKKPQN